MKNRIIRIISTALAALTVFSCAGLCFTAFSQTDYAVGDTVTFGNYPQTKVDDEETLTTLNSMLSEEDWIDMNYYIGSGTFGSEEQVSYYYYADKILNGEKYRAIYFTEYRPTSTYAVCPPSNSNAYISRGYYKNAVNWFKYEPINWRVLDPETGLIITRDLIEAQPYHNTHETIDGFSQSTIKEFLNDTFYNSAFGEYEKSAITSVDDKVTLLTQAEAFNESYGFTDNNSRMAGLTDYGIIGGYIVNSASGFESSNWLLKDKYNDRNVNCIYFFGTANTCEMNSVRGIRPVTYIDLSKANKYTVTYKYDGNILKTDEYEAGETIAPYIPDIEGYTFTCWDTVIPAVMPAHSIEANARTQINSYNLTLDANGGKFADGSEIKVTGTEYNSVINPEEPSRQGYSFGGWGEAPERMPANDLTLTADWTERDDTPYKIITYKENLSGEYESHSETAYARTNSDVSVTPEEFEGYNFDAGRSNIDTAVSAEGTSEIKLYYNLKTYELTFNFNCEKENITETIKHGQSIVAPVIPTRTGFAGRWDRDIPDTCTASGIYNVIWQENSYQISFNTDGGSNINNAVYTYGASVAKPADPVKEGYTFIGWDKDFPDTMPAENLEFTALWQINTYTVKWIANDELKEETYTYGEKIREPIVIVPEGYTFTGWNATVPATMPAENLDFTAQFALNEYSVTWIAGEKVLKKETYGYGDKITEPAAPEIPGFTFAWNNHADTMPSKDIAITGTYTVIPSPEIIPVISIINYKNTITLDYKTTITFRAKVENSADKPVQWYVNNELKGTGDTFTVNTAKETFNIKCATESSSGATSSSDTELVKVKTDFWSRIVAFFRMLFRRLPVITQ